MCGKCECATFQVSINKGQGRGLYSIYVFVCVCWMGMVSIIWEWGVAMVRTFDCFLDVRWKGMALEIIPVTCYV